MDNSMKGSIMKEVGETIREIINRNSGELTDMQDKMGVSISTVYNWKRGLGLPSRKSLRKLMMIYSLTEQEKELFSKVLSRQYKR